MYCASSMRGTMRSPQHGSSSTSQRGLQELKQQASEV